jgi:hypothetical protein
VGGGAASGEAAAPAASRQPTGDGGLEGSERLRAVGLDIRVVQDCAEIVSTYGPWAGVLSGHRVDKKQTG